jgi:hypothetical protein
MLRGLGLLTMSMSIVKKYHMLTKLAKHHCDNASRIAIMQDELQLCTPVFGHAGRPQVVECARKTLTD